MQMGNFIHYIVTFISGFAIGFSSLWKLALLTLSVVPAIALAGGIYAYALTGLTSKSQQAYAEAGGIAEQVCTQLPHQAHCLEIFLGFGFGGLGIHHPWGGH